ncbi:NADPH:quinone reductase [Nakamurella endophytica]|uniref:NADPH:quinone reductase n=1 Tax=Nakamurella endophytica TaxID=1748367 RepID=A0A917SVB5_9ACTN|nr:NADPH:quinone reductase [Nakamurella endophytica]GGL99609.1 NADPH:quinone reductase [Nakamurella endophytica]
MTSSATARAIVYSGTGGPEVLRLVDKPLQAPPPGHVRVRIVRSGVNPTDWKSRAGSGTPAPVDPPQVPGQDGAGIIDDIGAGVDVERVGQRVWLWEAAWQRPEGTTQDFAVVPAQQAVPLPDSASFDLGAGLGIPFLTAHRCLTVTEDGPTHLGPGALTGRTVFVAGGAGAVGNAAIQLARWADATVLTSVSSPDKAQLAAAAGADHVINYREQDVAAEVRKIVPAGVNTVVEVSPARNASIDTAILAPNGSIAIYANDGGSELTLPVRDSMAPNIRWQFVLVYTAPREAKERAVRAVSAALAAGAIRPVLPQHHFPLDQAGAAHQAVQDSVVGKVLIDVAD